MLRRPAGTAWRSAGSATGGTRMAETGKPLQATSALSLGFTVEPHDTLVATHLRRLAELARRALGACGAYVRSDPLTGSIQVAHDARGDFLDPRAAMDVAEALLGRIVRSGEPIASSALEHDGCPERFACLGVPLALPGGEHGALVVLDDAPRDWLQEDLALLIELAEAAADEIRLRAELASLHAEKQLHSAILDNMTDAYYVLDHHWRFI